MEENKMDSIKKKMRNVDLSKAKDGVTKMVNLIKRFIILILLISMFAGGFFIGARMHELGHLNGVLNKTLKGATITISGVCLVDGEIRSTLADDQVKVTAVDENKLLGVIRKTREYIECDLRQVSYDLLPLLANIGKTPIEMPELKAAERIKKDRPLYKLLENRVLLISGTCKTQDGNELSPFTDEKIDITTVEESKENPDVFMLSGIRRSDKVALVCSSKAIKYVISDSNEPEVVQQPLSYINKIITVTSRCVPDKRVSTPKGADGRKIAFFRLVNSPVQIIEEKIEDGKLVKLTGSIVDKKLKDGYGQMIICDHSVYPLTYAEYVEEDTTLNRQDSEKNAKDQVTPSSPVVDEADQLINQKEQEILKQDSNEGVQDGQ